MPFTRLNAEKTPFQQYKAFSQRVNVAAKVSNYMKILKEPANFRTNILPQIP
jgi:hypothetical protein